MATRAVEAGAAGHGAEPRGKRTEQGEATYLVAIAEGPAGFRRGAGPRVDAHA